MTLSNARCYKYVLPFKQPLKLVNSTLSMREGLIVELIDSDGHTGYGEIAPLARFSLETFEQALEETIQLIKRIISTPIDVDEGNLVGSLSGLLDKGLPSVNFGFCSALLWLMAKKQNTIPSKLLSEKARSTISINGLIKSCDDSISRANEFAFGGFKSIKIKLGEHGLTEDIKTVTEVIRAVDGKSKLRLDMNRRYTIEETISLMNNISAETIEYLEEPVGTIDELKQVIDMSYPVALDESLLLLPAEMLDTLFASDSVKAVVLKPTLLGISKSLEIADRAKAQNVTAVLSSSFESSIGLYMLANMAAAINDYDVPAGLDTWRSFERNTFKLPFNQSGSELNLSVDRLPEFDPNASPVLERITNG